ncbi:sulfotransferase domain-containing protein [Pseudalkalibacillus hwajinpoensis]|nr:sulfotransferase domain-containing protein [Pseudalkalibacillus hwajinpoensis]
MPEQDSLTSLPPFFMSSVPKSGTHLLHQLLNGIPNVSMNINDSIKKFFLGAVLASDAYYEALYQDHRSRLNLLKENEFGLGHVRYSSKYEDMLKEANKKHVFLYRDPRDVLVSLAYFIGEKWLFHPLHHQFQTTTDVKDRLRMLIQGVPGLWPDFNTYISSFYGWVDVEDVHKIRFEQLVESSKSRRVALGKLLDFLYDHALRDQLKEQIVNDMIANIDTSKSFTFRSGKISGWKREFDEELKELFKSQSNLLLTNLGYETDDNW